MPSNRLISKWNYEIPSLDAERKVDKRVCRTNMHQSLRDLTPAQRKERFWKNHGELPNIENDFEAVCMKVRRRTHKVLEAARLDREPLQEVVA